VALTAVTEPFVVLASKVADSMSAACAAMAALYCFIRYLDEGRRPLAFASGACIGVAYAIRYSYFSLVYFIALFVLFLDGGRIRERARTLALVLLGFLVAVAPLGVATFIAQGSFFYQKSHVTMAFNVLPSHDSWAVFQEYLRRYDSMTSVIVAHPREVAHNAAKNIYHFGELLMSGFYAAGLLAPAGLFLGMRRMSRERLLVFVVMSLTVLLFCVTAQPDYRYLLICAPFMNALAYVAVASEHFPETAGAVLGGASPLGKLLSAFPTRKLALVAMVAPPLIITSVTTFRLSDPEGPRADTQVRRAGIWLRSHAAPEDVIASTEFSIGYYAGIHVRSLSTLLPPDASPASLASVDWARHGVRYVAYVEKLSAYEYPRLASLVGSGEGPPPAGLRLLRLFDGVPRVAVYEVTPGSRAEQD
jgi:4-amino-4-deoxy-L-arabinose transferase-like glycosyltransferase